MCDTKYFIVTLNFHQQHLKHDLPHFAYIREIKKKNKVRFLCSHETRFFLQYLRNELKREKLRKCF